MTNAKPKYISDLVVQVLRELGIEYVPMNPGATIRGLHESFVNYGGNERPKMILCTHEEIAVVMAAGYYRATGRPQAVMVHDIGGLQHASIAIYEALKNRIPTIILGGTEPVDLSHRRPGIDWGQSAQVQADLVRNYVKWDDQPVGAVSVVESLLRGYQVAMTEPQGPVYICFDVETQEAEVPDDFVMPDISRFKVSSPPSGDLEAIEQVARALMDAEWPVLIVEGMGSRPGGAQAVESLADLLGIPVVTAGSSFSLSNRHSLNVTGASEEAFSRADLVISAGVKHIELIHKKPPKEPEALHSGARGFGGNHTRRGHESVISESTQVVRIGLDEYIIRPWSAFYGRLMPADVSILGEPTAVLKAITRLCQATLEGKSIHQRVADRKTKAKEIHENIYQRAEAELRGKWWATEPISSARYAAELWEAIKNEDWILAHGTLWGWEQLLWESEASRWTGAIGGVGMGMGEAMGVALAYRGSGKICVNILRDGDLLYIPGSLWTAAHYQLPLLTLMFNNRSYFQDEGHQIILSGQRGRPQETAQVGTRIENPATDFATLARAFDIYAEGPVTDPNQLQSSLKRSIEVVRQGKPALIDVITQSR
ncbi:MAG: hypothetical protein BZY82_08130 [SAR202 cluster bacterium Io17-Chloro-G3]|nr:MAG: hypothetical protein BZY82_08130 [SAR202 cluster bacterium Io17-Chloro-G3]